MKSTYFILGFLLGSHLVTDASAGGDYYKEYQMGEYRPSHPPPSQRGKYEPNPGNEDLAGSNDDYTEHVQAAPVEDTYVPQQESLYASLHPEDPSYVAYPDAGSYTTDTDSPGIPDSDHQAYPEKPTYTETSYTSPVYTPVAPQYSPHKQPRPQFYEPARPIYRPKKRNYKIQFYLKQKRKSSYQNQGIAYGTRYKTEDNQYDGSAQHQPGVKYGKKKMPHSPPRKQQPAPKKKPNHSSSTRNPPKGNAKHSQKKSQKTDKAYKMYHMHYV